MFDGVVKYATRLIAAALDFGLRKHPRLRSLYDGVKIYNIVNALRRSLQEGDRILTIDSASSTDGISFATIQRIYYPILPFVPSWVQKVMHYLTNPFPMAPSIERPRGLIGRWLDEYASILNRDPDPFIQRRRVHWGKPIQHLPLSAHLGEIQQALADGPLMLVAPTGMGKTVVVASMMERSIIQCTSIGLLESTFRSLTHFGIQAYRHYSENKELVAGPGAILTTACFVTSLAQKYPSATIILDEAETKLPGFLENLHIARELPNPVVAMTATPGNLNHGMRVLKIEGTTNYPITHLSAPDLRQAVRIFREQCSGRCLVIVQGEPSARKFALTHEFAEFMDLERRKDYSLLLPETVFLVATNWVRSGVNLPRVDCVIDTCAMYRDVLLPGVGMPMLLLTQINESESRQGAGRTGREGPGVYIKVDCTKTEVPDMYLGPLGSFANRWFRGQNPGHLAHKILQGSLRLEELKIRIASESVDFHPLCPQSVKAFSQPRFALWSRMLILFVGSVEQGLLSRFSTLANGSEEDINALEKWKISDPFIGTRDLLGYCEVKKYFRQELIVLKSWTSHHPQTWESSPWESASVREEMVRQFSTHIFRNEGEFLVNVVTGFSVPAPPGTNHKHILMFGLSAGRVNFEFVVGLGFDEDLPQFNLNEEELELQSSQVEDDRLSIVRVADNRTRTHGTYKVCKGQVTSHRPEDLPLLSEQIRGRASRLLVPEEDVMMCQSAHPMSLFTSKTALNVLRISTDDEGRFNEGTGDDAVVAGPSYNTDAVFTLGRCQNSGVISGEDSKILRTPPGTFVLSQIDWVSKPGTIERAAENRIRSGLRINTKATHILDPSCIAVLTERFFIPETGVVLPSLKAKGVNALLRCTPGLYVTNQEFRAGDFSVARREISKFEFLSSLRQNPENMRYSKRQTVTRSLAISLLGGNTDESQDFSITDECNKQLVDSVECLLQTRVPPTRGPSVSGHIGLKRVVGLQPAQRACPLLREAGFRVDFAVRPREALQMELSDVDEEPLEIKDEWDILLSETESETDL